MRTYKIIRLKVVQNVHLQKKLGVGSIAAPQLDSFALTKDRAMIELP